MNFGKWIVVAFVLFALFIGTLVTVCVKQDISLVSKEYYKDELAYQDQLRRLNNTEALTQKPLIKVVNQKLEIKFNQAEKIEDGSLRLFCPSNEKMDKQLHLKLHDEVQQFNLDGLQRGMYKAKLSWTMEGKEFFVEEIIYI